MAHFYDLKWTDLSIEVMTSLYLYGTLTPPPLEERIRSEGTITVRLDARSFFDTGPGRLALPSLSSAVKGLFEGNGKSAAVPPGSYTVSELKSLYGYVDDDFRITLYQSSIDINSSDWMLRSYVYNSEGFRITDDTIFHFGSEPNVSNLTVRAFFDNFDFVTNDILQTIGGDMLLRQPIDPYEIGQTVNISFTDGSSLPRTYARSDYDNDIGRVVPKHFGAAAFAANAPALVAELKSKGIFDYGTAENPIVFGSNQSDYVRLPEGDASAVATLVTGPGDDIIVGTTSKDIIYAGVDSDQIDGRGGGDIVYAGGNWIRGDNEEDTVVYTNSFGYYIIREAFNNSGDRELRVFEKNNLSKPYDTLYGVEWLAFGGANQITWESAVQKSPKINITFDNLSEYRSPDPVFASLVITDENELDDIHAAIGTLSHVFSLEFVSKSVVNGVLTVVYNISSNPSYNFDFELGQRYWEIDLSFGDGVNDDAIQHISFGLTDFNEAPTDIVLAPPQGEALVIEADGKAAVRVSENAVAGTLVAAAGLDDPEGDAGTWSLVDDFGGRFSIDTATGQIRTTGALDFEALAVNGVVRANLVVKAVDAGGWEIRRDLVVNVDDVNEAPTGIAFIVGGSPAALGQDGSPTLPISENLPAGTLVGNAALVDQDASDVGRWQLVHNPTGRFAIDEHTGAIKTTASLDYESVQSYQLVVRGIDRGGLWIERQVTVAVQDVRPVYMGTGGIDNFPGGSNENDAYYGLGHDDIFNGSPGADFFDGGDGFDTVRYVNSPGYVDVDLSTGIGSGNGPGGVSHATGDTYVSIENVTGSNGTDRLKGNAGNNVLDGGPNHDVLIASEGSDTLIGGIGTDTVDYGGLQGVVTVDLAVSAIKYGLGAGYETFQDMLSGIENVIGTDFDWNGRGDIIKGTSGNNVIRGRGGDDVLRGMGGTDTLDGGEGVDTASWDYLTSSQSITVDLQAGTTAGSAAGTTLISIENLTGGAGTDTLSGNAGDNVLVGGGGNDILVGRAGADTLDGGENEDEASYADSDAGVTVDLRTGNASGGHAQGDTLISIERVTGSAFVDRLTGNDGANTLKGGAGNDVILGGRGADQLDGGADVDTLDYSDMPAGVVMDIDLVAGTAVERSSAASVTDTVANFENVTGTDGTWSGRGDVIRGTSGVNVIRAGGGNDVIRGMGGADTLDGGEGVDTASWDHLTANQAIQVNLATGATGGAAAGVTLIGIENLTGGAGNDTLVGDAGANTLDGGGGDDVLDGGAGNDVIYARTRLTTVLGGSGADTVYASSGVILDYSAALGAVSLYRGTEYLGPSLIGTIGDAAGDRIYLGGFGSVIGSAFDDVLAVGSGGTLYGNSGNDRLSGYVNGDWLYGGDGNDEIFGGGGADNLFGGAGFDWINPGADKDVDTIDFGADGGGLSFHGGDNYYFNTITVDLETGTYSDGQGNGVGDVLVGQATGVRGTTNGDTINGSSQGDVLYGNGGADVIDGRAGDDYIEVGSVWVVTGYIGIAGYLASGIAHGGEGNDIIQATYGGEFMYGDGGDDVLRGYGVNPDGSLAPPTSLPPYTTHMYGGQGQDVMLGGLRANEVFHSLADGDYVKGQTSDTLSFDVATHGVDFDASTGTGSGIVAIGVGKVVGSAYSDLFTGVGASMYGGGGNDQFVANGGSYHGEAGDDVFSGHGAMYGGDGNDFYEISGNFGVEMGDGSDTLQFNWGNGSISGLTPGSDVIVLSDHLLEYQKSDGNGGFVTAIHTEEEWIAEHVTNGYSVSGLTTMHVDGNVVYLLGLTKAQVTPDLFVFA